MYVIKDDLKNKNFKPFYVLFGAENYLIRSYKSSLLKGIMDDNTLSLTDGNMNFTRFTGKDFTTKQVIQISETLPFFAPRRVILIEDSGLFSSEGEELADYLCEKPDTTYFIFAEHEVDKRSRLYKTVSSKGHAAEFKTQDEEMLKTWIVSRVRAEKKNITIKAVLELIERTDSDMELMDKELEKLFCYTMNKEAIDAKDVEEVCTLVIGNHIFDMISAMANKRQEEALNLYYELLALKEPPMKILFLLGKQFSQLLVVKDLRNKGYDKRRIAEKTQMKPFIVDKYMTQAAKFSTWALKMAVEDCTIADESLKNGKMSDRMSVEMILVKYSGDIA